MSRLLTHLPQLASLALAVIAAAVSHSVHVDRSASSRAAESPHQAARPTAARAKAHHRSASTHRSRSTHRSASPAGKTRRRVQRATRLRAPQPPPVRPAVVTVSAPAPRAPRPGPRHVDRLRAGPGVVRGVDPAFGTPTVEPG